MSADDIDTDDDDATAGLAISVFQIAQRIAAAHRSGAAQIPKTYRIWDAYANRKDEVVGRAIESAAARGKRLTETQIDSLHESFVRRRTMARDIASLGLAAADDIGLTSKDISRAAGDADDISRALHDDAGPSSIQTARMGFAKLARDLKKSSGQLDRISRGLREAGLEALRGAAEDGAPLHDCDIDKETMLSLINSAARGDMCILVDLPRNATGMDDLLQRAIDRASQQDPRASARLVSSQGALFYHPDADQDALFRAVDAIRSHLDDHPDRAKSRRITINVLAPAQAKYAFVVDVEADDVRR